MILMRLLERLWFKSRVPLLPFLGIVSVACPNTAVARPMAPYFASSCVVLAQQMNTSSPHPFALADMNRDGAVDLIALGGQDQVPLTIRFGDGYGNFGPQVRPIGTESMRELGSLYVSDVNGDGRPDLVIGYSYWTALMDTSFKRVDVLLGHGDGGFDPPLSTRTPAAVNGMAMGDMNEDGIVDVVGGGGGFVILLGDGTGHFVQSYRSSPNQDSQFELVDLDHDGHLDVASSRGGAYYGDGAGSISSERGYGYYPGDDAVATIDVDHDGAMDILTSGSQDSGRLVVHFGPPAAAFFTTRDYRFPIQSGPHSITVADLDRDGHPEIITAGSDVQILSMDPGGILRSKASLPSHSVEYPLYAEVFDVDRDGWPDLVVGGAQATAVHFGGPSGVSTVAPSISFGSPTAAMVTGDFMGNDRTQIAVLLPAADSMIIVGATPDGLPLVQSRFGVAHGSSAPAVTDVDNDGRDDLILVNAAERSLSVFRSMSGGSWERTDVPNVAPTPWVAVGDIDGDGRVDLLTLDDGSAYRLLGTGTGFGSPQWVGNVTWRPAGCLLDIDGDGQLDLILTDSDRGAFPNTRIYRGLSDGTFGWGGVGQAVGGLDVSTPDFNHDGRADFFAVGPGCFVAGRSSADLTIRLMFGGRQSAGHGGPGDVDGDGWPDFAITVGGYSDWNARYVAVFRNDQQGSFTEESWGYAFGGENLDRCVLADLTGDGLPDLVATEPTTGRVWLAPHVAMASTGLPAVAGAADGRVAFAGSAPNPTRGATVLRFALPGLGRAQVSIVDVKGRIVRRFSDRSTVPGEFSLTWDGRDDSGTRVRPGIYLARIEHVATGHSTAATSSGKLVVLP